MIFIIDFKSCIKKSLIGIAIPILFILKDQSREPIWSDYRNIIQWAILVLSISVIYVAINLCSSNVKTITNGIALVVVINLIFFLTQEMFFINIKYSVLLNKSHEMEQIGNHIIVGYHNYNELKLLVEKNAIAGIYITRRNLRISESKLHNQIQQLQRIRFKKKLPPLWVAADQEGGEVSHLSPPLTRQTSLSKVVKNLKGQNKIQSLIKSYVTIQGKELSELGINLNLSPVVDVKSIRKDNSKESFSRFYDRLISQDEKIVTAVALSYCNDLYKYKVNCTLKHFPGLGRVEKDTHFSDAKLDTSIAELEAKDWVPFRVLMHQTNAFVMLGHVILTKIDETYPVSISRKSIHELIRKKWNYRGVLLTDDFGMKPIYKSRLGAGGSAIEALNSGVDLLLFSSDPDMYYSVIYELLHAYKSGRLDVQQLKDSQERLAYFQLAFQ